MKMTKIVSMFVLVAFIAAEAYFLQPTTYQDVETQELQLETQKKKANLDYKQTKVAQEARKKQADLDRKKAAVELDRKKVILQRGY